MNKTQLITALRAHLADKEDIANEAAPALALMRYAVVELEKPTSGQVSTAEVDELRKELASADSTIEQLRDAVSDHEGILYSLLADLGMVPEVDDEPVDSLTEAVERVPNLLDDLQMKVSSLYADTGDGDKDRFIDAVRNLLEGEGLSLLGLWEALEKKAQYLEGLEKGIEQRDTLLLQGDVRLLAIREKLGIPEGAGGSVEQLELANIDRLIQQRQEAQDSLVRREPADDVAIDGAAQSDDMLEHIVEEIIAIVGLDWQDVETLPQHIKKLAFGVNQAGQIFKNHVDGHASWISDAIDLAYAVRGNLAPENRVMAKAAAAIILAAPRGKDA